MNKIDREFVAFHKANPIIFDKIVNYTHQLKLAGRKHYGIAAIIERVRWDYAIDVRYDEKGFKINNNFRSRYARLIEQKFPELKGFFRTRHIESSSMFHENEQFELL